jgi:hypothetical protein
MVWLKTVSWLYTISLGKLPCSHATAIRWLHFLHEELLCTTGDG